MSDEEEGLQGEGEEGEEGGGAEAEIEQGGILLLSDSDDSEEEEEEDSDLPEDEKRRILRAKAKKRSERKHKKAREAPPPTIVKFQASLAKRVDFGLGNYAELYLSKALADRCHGAFIFEGFPSKGFASVMISKFLVKGLELPCIGYVVSNTLPVVCRVTDCTPSHPYRVYGNSDIVVFTGELGCPTELAPAVVELIYHFQATYNSEYIFSAESIPKLIEDIIDLPDKDEMTESDIMELVEKVAKVQDKKKKKPLGESSESILTKVQSFFGADLKASDSQSIDQNLAEVLYVTNDEPTSNKMRKLGLLPVKNAVVGNVTGCLLAESVEKQCKVVCLVARYNPILSDARASVILVRTVGDILASASWIEKVHLLEKKADKIEKQIKKSIREMSASGKRNAPASYMYT